MSPLELIKAVEARDPEPIAQAAGVSIPRALSIIQALAVGDLAAIIAAPIDDGITLQLLDGSVYKKSQDVWIGQRCTIVLPVLLTRPAEFWLLINRKTRSTIRLLPTLWWLL